MKVVGRRYRLLKTDLTREQLARAGEVYQHRQERDKIRLQQMVAFVEGHLCRWQSVLKYFDGEELPDGLCRHCDNCAVKMVPLAS